MSLINFWQKKIRRFSVWDFAVFKIYLLAFALFIAKVWSPVLSLDWYWYFLIFVLALIWILYKLFSK